MPLSPDSRLGRYQILSTLGAGGMGEVYLAQDTTLRRAVAIKLLPAEFSEHKDRLARFEQEARTVAALNHPNIAHIYEIGEADGRRFITMEYVEGETLHRKIQEGKSPLRQLLKWLTQVAEGLTKAHSAGVVHRDLKPDNIMVSRDGYAKILDFGLAKLTEQQKTQGADAEAASEAATEMLPTQPLSMPGMVMGTVGYMSPEQAQGKVKEIDHRSDIFSFGCILFEAATRRRAFAGDSAVDSLHKIIYTPTPLVKDFNPAAPTDLQRIVRKCLAKEPEKRYQTMRDVANDLEDLLREIENEPEMERTAGPETVRTQASAVKDAPEENVEARRELAGRISDAREARTPLSADAASGIKRHSRSMMIVVASLALCVIVAAAVIAVRYLGRPNATDKTPIQSIAVLPFTNESHDTDTEYLSDGITESLINSLSQLPNIKVIARASVFRYKGQQIDVQQAAKELNVQAILTGRVIVRGDTLSISAELVDARDNHQLWGDHYTRKLADIFAVQDEIARQITDNLRLKLSGAEQQQIAKRYTGNVQAFEDYMQGRSFIHRRTREDIQTAISYYQKAIAEDQNYALAYAGLAEAYANLGTRGYMSPVEGRRKAEEAVQKALALDENLAEAHVAVGEIFVLFAPFNFPDADRELHHALELSPSLAAAHQYLGNSFVIQGRLDEALSEFAKAHELDPLSAIIPRASAAPYYLRRDYARALALLREANKLGPPFTTVWEICVYVQNSSFDEALAELDKAKQERPDDPILIFSLGRIYAAQGKRDDALQAIKELESTHDKGLTHSLFIAQLYAALNDKEQALSWLERGAAAWEIRWFL
ncbi:MAG TPA: protein kinase, partial [Pyrinomonadaceae bacterium]|nr:protein kinase [Pyrinomonadaceae bacterium]